MRRGLLTFKLAMSALPMRERMVGLLLAAITFLLLAYGACCTWLFAAAPKVRTAPTQVQFHTKYGVYYVSPAFSWWLHALAFSEIALVAIWIAMTLITGGLKHLGLLKIQNVKRKTPPEEKDSHRSIRFVQRLK